MINLEDLKFTQDSYQKKNFAASDFGKSMIDLYFSFIGEPVTNPPSWSDTLKWGAGKGVEEQMLLILKMNHAVKEDYDQKKDGRIEHKYKSIQINGYIDAISVNGTPIEIKSINNANKFDISKYENGNPRENYVGQLATYMEAKGERRGFLFVASIDGLSHFWFECTALGEGKYKCGSVVVDLYKEWDKWRVVQKQVQEKDETIFNMYFLWQYRYKYPVEEIDWTKVSATDISKARNGHKVIGDWQIGWSSWKNKIIQMQGTVPGYTAEEMAIIREKTDGYTTWKKKKSVV
jgi:hypothetical protein